MKSSLNAVKPVERKRLQTEVEQQLCQLTFGGQAGDTWSNHCRNYRAGLRCQPNAWVWGEYPPDSNWQLQ